MNVAVIFHSVYGATATLAEAVAAGAEEVGATVRLRQAPAPIREELRDPRRPASSDALLCARSARLAATPSAGNDDLVWADGVVFGSPGRYRGLCVQLRRFLDGMGDLRLTGALTGKVAGVFSSVSADPGEHGATLLSMVIPLFHLGFLIQGLPSTEAGPASLAEPHGGKVPGATCVGGGRGAPPATALDLTPARALGRRIALAAGRLSD